MAERGTGSFVDRTLAERLRAGDEFALGDLYDLHGGFVHALARRIVRNPEAAEDVTQEVFTFIWECPERYNEDRGTLRAFLGTITHRRSVDLIRREEARKRREAADALSDPVDWHTDDDVADSVDAGLVRRAMASLPDAQRRCLELAYFDGLTYRQVATTLGIPEGTAKSRLRLALARIADALQPLRSEP